MDEDYIIDTAIINTDGILTMQWSRTPHQNPRLALAYVITQPPAIGTRIVAIAKGRTCIFNTENALK